MAAAVGFEPTDVGVKFQCLATWLRRHIISRRLEAVEFYGQSYVKRLAI